MGDSADISRGIVYEDYHDERQLREIALIVAGELSEPYSTFTYRYFLVQWPRLCICVYDQGVEGRPLIGSIVCKVEVESDGVRRGYIGMLVVDKKYRGCGIGSALVKSGIQRMIEAGSEEIYLETEASNTAALYLYERLGFAREERMAKYYLNGGDAFRLKLWLERPLEPDEELTAALQEISAADALVHA